MQSHADAVSGSQVVQANQSAWLDDLTLAAAWRGGIGLSQAQRAQLDPSITGGDNPPLGPNLASQLGAYVTIANASATGEGALRRTPLLHANFEGRRHPPNTAYRSAAHGSTSDVMSGDAALQAAETAASAASATGSRAAWELIYEHAGDPHWGLELNRGIFQGDLSLSTAHLAS